MDYTRYRYYSLSRHRTPLSRSGGGISTHLASSHLLYVQYLPVPISIVVGVRQYDQGGETLMFQVVWSRLMIECIYRSWYGGKGVGEAVLEEDGPGECALTPGRGYFNACVCVCESDSRYSMEMDGSVVYSICRR